MPTGAMAATLSALPCWTGGAGPVITDVGSVKRPVVEELTPLALEHGSTFVGSHPMAGSEKTGIEHAEPDLFVGATVITTPGPDQDPVIVGRIRSFWESLGAGVEVMPPGEHDAAVAAISHLPHLAAAALVRSVMDQGADLSNFCGGGFHDTTRVAGGPPDMWTGILADNREAVSARLEAYIDELQTWKEALDSLDTGQLRGFLSRAQELRRSL